MEIAALTLSEIAGNAIVPTLPGMPSKGPEWYRDTGIELLDTLGVAMGKIPTSVRMFWKNSVSNQLHYLYSAAISKTLGEASPAIDARKTPSALRSLGSIQSSVASKASTLDSMGISHHLKNMHVRPRSIDKILEKNAADTADGKDDDTTRKLEADFEHEDGSNQSQEAHEDSGTMDWEGEG